MCKDKQLLGDSMVLAIYCRDSKNSKCQERVLHLNLYRGHTHVTATFLYLCLLDIWKDPLRMCTLMQVNIDLQLDPMHTSFIRCILQPS